MTRITHAPRLSRGIHDHPIPIVAAFGVAVVIAAWGFDAVQGGTEPVALREPAAQVGRAAPATRTPPSARDLIAIRDSIAAQYGSSAATFAREPTSAQATEMRERFERLYGAGR